MPIRTLIVDDEPLARRRLAQFLAEEPGVAVVGEAPDGASAVAAIQALAPDLVFLDIQMPEVDGFDVLEALQAAPDGARLPEVIFATAYDEFALRAFDANAVDYLLKPFTVERFRAALARARARLERAGRDAPDAHEALTQQMRRLLDTLQAGRRHAERLVVRVGPKIVFVRVADVDWIDTDGNYVRLHVKGRAYLLRETLAHLAERLPPERFVRVHRSSIVNVDRIKEIQPYGKGTYHLRLEDGTELTSTLTYRDQLRTLLGEVA